MAPRTLSDPQSMFETMQVLGWRLPMLGLAMMQPNAARRRETVRMVTEKQEALALGLIGAQAALAQAWLAGTTDISRIATDMARAAEAPALAQLGRNARRLSKKRP